MLSARARGGCARQADIPRAACPAWRWRWRCSLARAWRRGARAGAGELRGGGARSSWSPVAAVRDPERDRVAPRRAHGGRLRRAVNGAAAGAARRRSRCNETLDYTWELYLPRLPFMHHADFTRYAAHLAPGSTARSGTSDGSTTPSPCGCTTWASYLSIALAVLGADRVVATPARSAARLRCSPASASWRRPDGAPSATPASATATATACPSSRPATCSRCWRLLRALHRAGRQGAAAALGAGARRALLVVLAMAHGLFAETLTISRYYG